GRSLKSLSLQDSALLYNASSTNHPPPHLKLSPSQRPFLTKSTLTPSCGNRFTTTSGSNIPNGSSQMASLRCAILTRRASWNCSTLRREGDRLGLSLILIASSNRD